MKANFTNILVAAILLMAAGSAFSQIAINTDGTLPDNSAMLDVKSTTKGMLAPRMTLAQRNAIVSPAKGLTIFQTDGEAGLYYNAGTPAIPAWALVGINAGQWLNNGTSIYYNNGYVGIGTIPEASLHVAKNTGNRTGNFGTSISPWTSGTNVAVGNDNEDAVFYVGQAPGREGYILWQYNSNPADAYYSIGTYNGINNLTLQEYGGNVGVRTSSPAAIFHVAEYSPGNTALFGTSISGYTAGTNVSIGDDNATSLLYLGQSASNKGFLIWNYNATPSNGYFGVGTYAGNNPLVLQSAGGNVGIGTTVPASLLDVQFDNNTHNYLGYSNTLGSYFYHNELAAEGDGQASFYAYRTRDVQNDGTAYGSGSSNTAIKGYSYWGDQYTFGTSGFNYNDYGRCGGVLGAQEAGSYWGALGYKNSSLSNYGGYFSSYTSGTGKNSQPSIGIGIGAWGDLIGADIHGKVYGVYAEGENYSMYSNGPVYKNNIDVHLQQNGTGTNTVLFTNVSTEVTVQTSGYATLSDGKASIAFDPAFIASVSSETPVVVTVTPTGNSNGVYLSGISKNGFSVVENNNGKSSVTVSFIAIGKRAGYEHPNLPKDVIDAGYTGIIARGLHNDADTKTKGEGLYYENGLLIVGVHPSVLSNPGKPAIETVIPKPGTPPAKGALNPYSSSGIGEAALVKPQVPVKEIPDINRAGEGKPIAPPVQQTKPVIKEDGNASERSKPK
jgi:hypothetical protein